ncbi:serine/threonine-protein kinase [Paraliomyxa miuraensis]|uniref:serine/threonine-protein kinase n=1 Tax=Paraliomyxa miuraensis TaxID=376150 RepID=UPI002254AE8D|nr:serine/threonine-protein kinase [Paraliomyxa miuraensis]MCX4243465.1 protein kinase [Paraliomyxa miuraensis]
MPALTRDILRRVQPGDVIAGRFVVERVAGAGAMGTVYRCLDREGGGPAAVKVLGQLTLDHARRFEREAWILSELSHPGVVRSLGHGVTADGQPFLAMEWLEGEDLSARLHREQLGVDDVLLLARQVTEALAQAHRHGIIHRDIKPANLFLVGGELSRIKVLDFGVARFLRPALDSTHIGVTIGTPSYMSPEQGDLPTVRYVDGVLRTLVDQPLFVLALARPSVHDAFPELWASRDLQEIRLRPLSRRAAGELLRRALDRELEPDLVDRLVAQAEGNAFYLEELARAVAQGRSDGLPDSVLAMVEARLEELSVDERRVLRAASVFGSTFWAGGVAALLGKEGVGAELTERLRGLVGCELVARRRGSRFPDHQEFVFQHSLVREAAAAMLSTGDRALGHRLAAQWLEDAGETDPIVLAGHWQQGQEPTRAARWLVRAAELALEGNDFAATIERARQGLPHASDDEQRGLLLMLEAEALRWQGRLPEALRAARTATGVLPPGTVAWYRSLDVAVTIEGQQGEFIGAERRYEVLMSAKPRDGAEGSRAIALCSTARQLFQGGRYDLAERSMAAIAAAVEHPERLGPSAMAEVTRLRGARARHAGDVAGDLRWYAASLSAFEEAGDTRQACNGRVSLGFAHVEVGALERAKAELQRARSEAQRLGLHTVDARARQNLALALAAEGELARAEAMLHEVVTEATARDNLRFASWTRIYLAKVALASGNAPEAARVAAQAAEELVATPPARAGALAALARAHAASGERPGALRASAEALAVLEEFGGLEEFESLIRLARIEALLAAGDRPAARAVAEAARARVQQLAGTLSEQRWQQSFVEVVPENRRIMELAAELSTA